MERMRIKKGVTILTYLVSARSNRGNVKENNQDACTVKTASTALGEVAFGLICDGMGGLSEGETASATVISAFSDWFYNALPFQLGAGQKLVPNTVDKARRLRKWLDENGHEDIIIETDGNMSNENCRKLYEAGARMFVAGTSSLVKPQVEGIDERIAENRKNICPLG